MSSPQSPDATGSERATGVRHIVVAVTVLMAVLLYLDRFCVSFAERYIKEDLALTETQTAWFISLFFWAYALGQVPSGWMGDRFGIRGVLTLYILVWSLFTALIGIAAGAASLLVMRFGCGLAQSGAYPSSASLLSKWVPVSSRGLASALVALGGRIGGAIAPILTAYLMVLFVPLSTPALLESRQLLAPDSLSAKLAAAARGEGTPAEKRFASLWPADSPDHLEPGASPDVLREGLNTLLRRPDLYRDEDFGRLRNLERDAVDLLAARRAGTTLSEQQTERLNRLLLEATFPAEIGKLYVRGWRPVVISYGLAGIVVALFFGMVFRNSPSLHPRCNAAERALIDAGRDTAAAPVALEPLPIAVILRSRSLWLSSISQLTTNLGWLFLVTFLARYLVEVHEVPILERSWMAAVPPLAGIAGMFLGGQFTDTLVRRIGLRWGRAIPMAATKFFAAGAYVACLWLDRPWAATIALAASFFFADLGVSAIWAFMQDVGGRHVGSMLGWGNMWGNIGAALAPPMYNWILGERPAIAQWNLLFLTCAAMLTIAGLTALFIDATVPIREE